MIHGRPATRTEADQAPVATAPDTAASMQSAARGGGSRELQGRVRALSLSRLPERGSSVGRSLLWLGVFSAAIGGAWYGYRAYSAATSAAEERASVRAPTAIPSSVSQTQPSTAPTATNGRSNDVLPPAAPTPSAATKGDVILEAKGYVIPAHQILVSPKVSGMILTLN